MSWLKNVLAGIDRTMGAWLADVTGWFAPNDKPGDGMTLCDHAQVILDQVPIAKLSASGFSTISEWARYGESLGVEGQRLIQQAGQEVVNKRADPTTEYVSVFVAVAFSLYRAQRQLPGDHWDNLNLLDIASFVTHERIVATDWDTIYREWSARGLKEARTISHAGVMAQELRKLCAGVFEWCQSRAAEEEPRQPQRSARQQKSTKTAKNTSGTNPNLPSAHRQSWQQGEFREYMERIRQGEKLPIEEQSRVIQNILGTPGGNDHVGPVLLKGLAGTGKTVMLALVMPELACRFHRDHGRAARILVYHFNNYLRRTLRHEFGNALKSLHATNTAGSQPEIVYAHLWGLSWRIGNELQQSTQVGGRREALLPELLRVANSPQWNRFNRFDIILVDEGQDLLTGEYQLLASCLSEGGRLIIAFDDFQNVMSGDAKPVRERVGKAIPGTLTKEISLTTCIRSNPVVFSTALSTLLGPSLTDPGQRQTIKDAICLDDMIDAGSIETIPWPDRSGFDLYGARFCMFPKGPPPRIVVHQDEAALHRMVSRTLRGLTTKEDGRPTIRMTILITGIVNAVLERMADALLPEYQKGNLPPVMLRSGPQIQSKMKQQTDVVAPGVINIANVNDAKGAEADVVFVIDPDCSESGASALKKRALFYVAATRAKVLLQVDGVKRGNMEAPILSDARAVFEAFDALTKEAISGQECPLNSSYSARSAAGNSTVSSSNPHGDAVDSAVNGNPIPSDGSTIELFNLLKKADKEELQALGRVLFNDATTQYWRPSKLIEELCSAGGHSVANLLRGEGVSYAEIVTDVYAKLAVQEHPIPSTYLEKEAAIVRHLFAKIVAEMTPDQRAKFEEELKKTAEGYGVSLTGIGVAGGSLAIAGAAGFAPFLMATSALSALTGALGMTLPFAAYTGLTSTLGVIIGPVGWVGLASYGIFKLGSPNFKKTIPSVVFIHTVRSRLELER